MNAVLLGHIEHVTCLSCAGAFSIYTCMGLKIRFSHSHEFLVKFWNWRTSSLDNDKCFLVHLAISLIS